ncbi:MAG: hypothetical protein ACE15D_19250 [Candidatus Eisenbacteria bacterium]
MRRPLVRWAARRIRQVGLYVVARLKAWLGLPVEIVSDFIAWQGRLVSAIATHDEASDRTVEARAVCDHRKGELTTCVRRLASELKVACGNSVRAPLYQFLFPKGLPLFTRSRASVVLEQAEELHRKLGLEGCPPVVAAFAEPLATLKTSLDEAVHTLEECEVAEARAKADYENEKRMWMEAYDRLYHRLRAHFATQPEIAETFFMAPSTRRRVSEEEPEAVETGANGGDGSAVTTPTTAAPAATPPATATPTTTQAPASTQTPAAA